MATYEFMLINETAVDHPEMYGYDYALKHKDEWIENGEFHEYLTAGYVRGCDYIVKDDVVYFIRKTYLDITNNKIIIICEQSINYIDIVSATP